MAERRRFLPRSWAPIAWQLPNLRRRRVRVRQPPGDEPENCYRSTGAWVVVGIGDVGRTFASRALIHAASLSQRSAENNPAVGHRDGVAPHAGVVAFVFAAHVEEQDRLLHDPSDPFGDSLIFRGDRASGAPRFRQLVGSLAA